MSKRIFIYTTLFVLLLNLLATNFSYAKEEEVDELRILFTGDLHDHIEDYNVLRDGKIKNIGGYGRISSLIKAEKKKGDNLLIADVGDFSMGTLYQTIFEEEAPTLRLLGELGYDITTLGNHEFDFRARGLGNYLKAAKNSEETLPKIVASNIDFSKEIPKESIENVKILKEGFDLYGVEEYSIIEKSGIKIGLFGLLGDEAISNAPMAEVGFSNYIEKAKEVVDKLKKEEVDIIIALSHSGLSRDKSKSEDEILAKKVPEIDVILSGHSHTALQEPIIVNDTIIAASGNYGEYVGLLEVKKNDKKWDLKNYNLIPLDENIKIDKSIVEKTEEFKDIVQSNYLDLFNLKFDEVLAYSDFNFVPSNEIAKEHKEEPLANLLTDSYIHTVKEVEGENYKPITAAIVPSGTIRDSFTKGEITVSDVFNVSSLGIGPDGVSGYPLVSVYLTGKDLKTAAEVDASIAPIMSVAQLYMSGINYKFNDKRIIFDKLTDIYIVNEKENREEIKDDELYRVVAGLYTGQMLSVVKDQSYGLLSIIPRDENGKEIENFEDHIIYDGDKEIKEWYAVANYIDSFEDGKIPNYYQNTHNRKVVESDNSIKGIFSNPSNLIKKAYAILAIIVILIIFLIRWIFKKKKEKKKETR